MAELRNAIECGNFNPADWMGFRFPEKTSKKPIYIVIPVGIPG